jgi:hypothetical protein
VPVSADDISFSTTLSPNSNYRTRSAGASADSRYAMCTLRLEGVPMTISRVIGIGDRDVGALAVATLAPAQSSCALPIGVCRRGAGPDYGFTPGDWMVSRFEAGGGATGNFNWIDFTPEDGGGARELTDMLAGTGTCNTGNGEDVGKSGILGNAAAMAWNTRFGLYQGRYDPESSPPDFTGYSYTPTNWPTQRDALRDFLNPQRVTNAPYQGNAQTGLRVSNAGRPLTPDGHARYGANRRLAVAPVVDCAGWASNQTPVPIEGFACVLMLHPISSPQDEVYMEYVGRADDPASPCSTVGLAGDSEGPLVPVLVQ